MNIRLLSHPDIGLLLGARDFHVRFRALASPCEIRLETSDAELAGEAILDARREAARIESKFSLRGDDSVIARINNAGGRETEVDEETADLLDFAQQAHELGDGIFDVPWVEQRREWHFDGGDRVPNDGTIAAAMAFVGWDRVHWSRPAIRLPKDLAIDLGGVVKDYAVDRIKTVIAKLTDAPQLINFGDDLCVSASRLDRCWNILIGSNCDETVSGLLKLADGALATSGDPLRFVATDDTLQGRHWGSQNCDLVPRAPRSVAAAAGTCLEAGLIATLAMLQGQDAEDFLDHEGVRDWFIA